MSAGSRSLVNWMRWYDRPSARAMPCARMVLPTPGISSISRCPPASRQVMHRRSCVVLPRTTQPSMSSARPSPATSSAAVTGRAGCDSGERTHALQSLVDIGDGGAEFRRATALFLDHFRGGIVNERRLVQLGLRLGEVGAQLVL